MEQHIHYICGGSCGGSSENPGNCQSENCERFGDPLEPCMCADGSHGGATGNGEYHGEREDEMQ